MDRDEEYWVSEAMIRYGGGFAAALGQALRLADDVNSQKIKDTFLDLWEYFAGLGPKARRDRDAEDRKLAAKLREPDGMAQVLCQALGLKGDEQC